ncbi:beta-1,3-galactosyltransferase 6-like [Dysidea avara]|uniref:beta-1,3-galactosyltransferase 6-like n=1 Tax=Dysidea avara TaxID=196820 RepID=UPI0033271011
MFYWTNSSNHVGCGCQDQDKHHVTAKANVDIAIVVKPNEQTNTAKGYLLLVIALSSPDGKARRDTIRQTWYSESQLHQDVLLKFVIGTMSMAKDKLTEIIKENDNHQDLLLLDNLVDSFANLTRKVLYSYIWAGNNVQFSYLLKCDDDTFVVLKTLLDELRGRTSHRMYCWGFFDGRASVKRAGKYRESEWYLCDKYLPYALGGGYVLSADLVKLIALNSDHLKLYVNEDVSVGAWLAPYNIERNHDVRFDTEYQSRGCNNAYIVTHKQTTQMMLEKHKTLKEAGKLCQREVQYKPSYIYNWDSQPSECCRRQAGIP